MKQPTHTRSHALTYFVRATVACILFLLVARQHLPAMALAEPTGPGGESLPAAYVLPGAGCPMAHCTPGMTDWVNRPPPAPEAAIIWHDVVETDAGMPFGANQGLGCAGNDEIIACSFGKFPNGYPDTTCDPAVRDTVVVYANGSGLEAPQRLWSSGDLLNCTAFTSAPMVGLNGDVIAADTERLIRFDAAGTPLWITETPGGIPISPVPVLDSLVAMATSGGPVSLYDSRNGALIDSLELEVADGFFETVNTPSVRDGRLYVSTQHSVQTNRGRLYALTVELPLDYDPAIPDTYLGQTILDVAWYFEFGGPSGASPLVVGRNIYFDGDRLDADGPIAPHVYAVRDAGPFPMLLWTTAMPGVMRASFALDPRGGFWFFSAGAPAPENRYLTRMALRDSDGDGSGDILEQIDLDALVGETGLHVPYSALSLAGTNEAPSLILAATAIYQDMPLSTYLVAVDLNTRSLLWKAGLPRNLYMGQFPIMNGPAGPRVFFTGFNNGLWVVGNPVE